MSCEVDGTHRVMKSLFKYKSFILSQENKFEIIILKRDLCERSLLESYKCFLTNVVIRNVINKYSYYEISLTFFHTWCLPKYEATQFLQQ